MWALSAYCSEDGVLVCEAQSLEDINNKIYVCRDLAGGFNFAVWIDTPSFWADVELLFKDGDIVMAFKMLGQIVEHPCYCALLTASERICDWLIVGGVVIGHAAEAN